MTAAPYTVLARRYRPQTFNDVVGQAHVGHALQNAIRAGRVAHAYLFTGARGVGKTSTARIFAKALNCPHAVDAVPCNECEICQGISTGSDVDVLEIDGASNRGIDDIRQLRANVNVKSMRSRYKVYIIDEVHMLTKEAFNALLKTLEEPPPNVKFVFCTTEPNKVPDTILSRCQRFDFGTIATGTIAARLTEIAAAEGIEVDQDAVELVARRAAGSMRDSQSLFDQLLAFGEAHITTEDVHRLLGTAPDQRLIDLFDALHNRDRSGALELLAEALDRGVQLGPFSDQLLEYLRDLLIVLAGAQSVPLLSVSESQRPRLAEQGERWGIATVTAAMQVLAETKSRMQRVNYGRALVELALIRISLLENLDDIASLLQRVGSGGTPVPAGGSSGSTPGGRPSEGLRQRLQSPPGAASAPGGGAGRSAGSGTPSLSTTPPTLQPAVARPATAAVPSPPVGLRTRTEQPPSAVLTVQTSPSPTASAKPGSATSTYEEDSVPVAVAEEAPATLTPERVEEFWAQVLQQVPEKLATNLKNATNVAISAPSRVEIVFPRSCLFSMNYCQRGEAQSQLERVAEELAGFRVEFRFRAEQAAPVAEVRTTPAAPRHEETRLRPKAVENDPFVQKAVAIFGGTVIDVRRVIPESTAESVDSGNEAEIDDTSPLEMDQD